MSYRWGFIGCGNLAQAIIGGAVQRGTLSSSDISATDVDSKKLEQFSQATGLIALGTVGEVADQADLIVIATKPQDVLSVLENLERSVDRGAGSGKGVISLAAGVSSSLLLKRLSHFDSITRVMANTPALVQKGLFGVYSAKKKAEHEDEITRVFASLGEVIPLKKDSEIDVLTSGSASGVGFVLSFMEEFERWLKKKGIKSDSARLIAIETFLGTATLAKERKNLKLSDLREAVTSKKGTTLAGLNAMKKGRVAAGLRSGLESGYRRAVEIAKNLQRGGK